MYIKRNNSKKEREKIRMKNSDLSVQSNRSVTQRFDLSRILILTALIISTPLSYSGGPLDRPTKQEGRSAYQRDNEGAAPRRSRSPHEHPAGRGGNLIRELQSLNLTAEQKNVLNEILETTQKNERENIKELMQSLRQQRKQLKELMTSDAKSDEIIELRNALEVKSSELKNRRFALLLKIREVLTPEQRKNFNPVLGRSRQNQE
jgi:Spy/CpxP family protein refolding chaperone